MIACDDTITLVKCGGETYSVMEISGVSWFDKIQVKLEGTGLAFANMTVIRIPAASILPGMPLPEVGDHVVRGPVPENAVLEKPADLAVFHPRKVMSVGDNRRGNLPHVKVVCQ